MPTLTNEIYRASKDPRVNALQDIKSVDGLPDIDQRLQAASRLDKEGLIIDMQIDIWGWDPVKVMAVRESVGYPWGPNAFQPNLTNPFKLLGGPYTDMSQPWPRSIKVSTDAKDYPAFAPPPPPVPVSASPIGQKNGDSYFVNQAVAQVSGQWLFKDGQEYVEGGKTYIFHNQPGMFGPMVSWTDK